MLSGLGDMGLNLLLLLLSFFGFLDTFDNYSLDLFGYLAFLLFSLCCFFLILSNLHVIHPEGWELDAALSIICKHT